MKKTLGLLAVVLNLALCGITSRADDLAPPANAGTVVLSPSEDGSSSSMVATVDADGMRYGFNLTIPGTEGALYIDTVKYTYDKASIAWSETDALGQWQDHTSDAPAGAGAGWVTYIDKRIWQTQVLPDNPDYVIHVTGKRRRRIRGGGGTGGDGGWEDWGADVRQVTTTDTNLDASIRNDLDTDYTGVGIYNTTGANQTVQQTVASNYTLSKYVVRLARPQTDSAVIVVKGTSGGAGSKVQYTDLSSNMDVTQQVTSTNGWNTVAMSGHSELIAVQVIPQDGVLPGTSKTVTINATMDGEEGADTVRAITTLNQGTNPPPPSGPTRTVDAAISASANDSYVGTNVFTTGDWVGDQTLTQTCALGSSVTYYIRVQNLDEVGTSFKLNAPAAVDGWGVVYSTLTGTDITAGMTGEGWTSPTTLPQEYCVVKMQVSPRAPAVAGANDEVDISAMAMVNNLQTDMVAALTRIPPPPPPVVPHNVDLTIRAASSTDFTGLGVFNTDGTSQTVTQSVIPSETDANTATFDVQVQNAGSIASTFKVKGPVSNNGWVILYKNSDGADITADITGLNGWTTSTLAAGDAATIHVQIVGTANIAVDQQSDDLVSAVSADGLSTDAVLATAIAVAAPIPETHIADLAISSELQPIYVGDGIYSRDGSNENVSDTVLSGDAATYQIKLTNRSLATDQFWLTAPLGDDGWTKQFYLMSGDAIDSTQTEITADITGEGWTSPEVLAGDTLFLKVVATPPDDAANGAISQTTVSALAVSDVSSLDTVVGVSTFSSTDTNNPPTVDLLIRNHLETDYIGDGVTSLTATGETKSQSVAPARTAYYDIEVVNPTANARTFALHTSTVPNGWTVKYFDSLEDGNEITSDFNSAAGWTTPQLAPGASCVVRVEVTPATDTASAQSLDTAVVASSDGTLVDAVKATTTVGSAKIDALIRGAGDADYIGDETYNTDGTNQTKILTAALGTTVVYNIKLASKGQGSDRIQVLGLGDTAGRTVKYYDSLTGGNDITADVTGDGWLTPVLDPGATREIRVEVTLTNPATNPAPDGAYSGLYHVRTEKADPNGGDPIVAEYDMIISASDIAKITNGDNIAPAQLALDDPTHQYQVALTPAPVVQGDVLIQATSLADFTKIDVVKASTTEIGG